VEHDEVMRGLGELSRKLDLLLEQQGPTAGAPL
jgi:hypothetical protein